MIKISFLDRLFPPKYNFYQRLSTQADMTALGVECFLDWLGECHREPVVEGEFICSHTDANETLSQRTRLFSLVDQADEVRFIMEEELVGAFSTPFARQDIYHLSVQMDRIIESIKATVLVMEAFAVLPDEICFLMAKALTDGAGDFAQAVGLLESQPIKSRDLISNIRYAQQLVENNYRKGMSLLLVKGDPMDTIKYREVYHQLKETGHFMGDTVDILHKIVVRLV